jgi:hypothetical protein
MHRKSSFDTWLIIGETLKTYLISPVLTFSLRLSRKKLERNPLGPILRIAFQSKRKNGFLEECRVARWFIFYTKNISQFWYILKALWRENFDILMIFDVLYGHKLCIVAIWYTYVVAICYIILILVYCIKKNLATR